MKFILIHNITVLKFHFLRMRREESIYLTEFKKKTMFLPNIMNEYNRGKRKRREEIKEDPSIK